MQPQDKLLKDYSEAELIKALETQSAIFLNINKQKISDKDKFYKYLCKLAYEEEQVYEYMGIRYKIIDSEKITSEVNNRLLQSFKSKMPVISLKDPLIINHIKENCLKKKDNKLNRSVESGALYAFYRDYEKNVPEYFYFRVLK